MPEKLKVQFWGCVPRSSLLIRSWWNVFTESARRCLPVLFYWFLLHTKASLIKSNLLENWAKGGDLSFVWFQCLEGVSSFPTGPGCQKLSWKHYFSSLPSPLSTLRQFFTCIWCCSCLIHNPLMQRTNNVAATLLSSARSAPGWPKRLRDHQFQRQGSS